MSRWRRGTTSLFVATLDFLPPDQDSVIPSILKRQPADREPRQPGDCQCYRVIDLVKLHEQAQGFPPGVLYHTFHGNESPSPNCPRCDALFAVVGPSVARDTPLPMCLDCYRQKRQEPFVLLDQWLKGKRQSAQLSSPPPSSSSSSGCRVLSHWTSYDGSNARYREPCRFPETHNARSVQLLALIPLPVLGFILSFLDPIELAHAAVVNKRWLSAAHDDHAWFMLVRDCIARPSKGKDKLAPRYLLNPPSSTLLENVLKWKQAKIWGAEKIARVNAIIEAAKRAAGATEILAYHTEQSSAPSIGSTEQGQGTADLTVDTSEYRMQDYDWLPAALPQTNTWRYIAASLMVSRARVGPLARLMRKLGNYETLLVPLASP